MTGIDLLTVLFTTGISDEKVDVEADTEANITVVKSVVLEELDWITLELTEVRIRGCSEIYEPGLRKSTVNTLTVKPNLLNIRLRQEVKSLK